MRTTSRTGYWGKVGVRGGRGCALDVGRLDVAKSVAAKPFMQYNYNRVSASPLCFIYRMHAQSAGIEQNGSMAIKSRDSAGRSGAGKNFVAAKPSS